MCTFDGFVMKTKPDEELYFSLSTWLLIVGSLVIGLAMVCGPFNGWVLFCAWCLVTTGTIIKMAAVDKNNPFKFAFNIIAFAFVFASFAFKEPVIRLIMFLSNPTMATLEKFIFSNWTLGLLAFYFAIVALEYRNQLNKANERKEYYAENEPESESVYDGN